MPCHTGHKLCSSDSMESSRVCYRFLVNTEGILFFVLGDCCSFLFNPVGKNREKMLLVLITVCPNTCASALVSFFLFTSFQGFSSVFLHKQRCLLSLSRSERSLPRLHTGMDPEPNQPQLTTAALGLPPTSGSSGLTSLDNTERAEKLEWKIEFDKWHNSKEGFQLKERKRRNQKRNGGF